MRHSDAPPPFASWHEFYVSAWADELERAGIILGYEFEPETFQLCDPLKAPFIKEGKTRDLIKDQAVLRPHSYTPDFKLLLPTDFCRVFRHYDEAHRGRHHGLWASTDRDGRPAVYLEVKGAGATTRGAEGKKREAVINQKWLFSKTGILTNFAHIGPGSRGQQGKTFFEQTFCPFRFLVTDKTLKQRRLHFTPRSIEDWIASCKL